MAYRAHVDPLVGPAAFQAFRTKFQTDNPKGTSTWSTDAIRIAKSGELAVQTGPYHDTALGPNGDREDKGRFVTVWTKVNGEWKVAHDIGSTTSPDAAQAGWEVGSWKLNRSLSKVDADPPPQSAMQTWVDRGGGVQVFTTEGVNAKGQSFFSQWTLKYDGMDYPTPDTGIGQPGRTSQSYKRVDALTVEHTTKANGKVTGIFTRTLSKDGTSMTYRVVKNAQGQATSDTRVYDKQ